MKLQIDVHLKYRLDHPTDMLMQIEPAAIPGQVVTSAHLGTSDTAHFARVPGEDAVGERIWIRAEEMFSCMLNTAVEINRTIPDFSGLAATPCHLLPGDAVKYLLSSRYCPSDEFQSLVKAEFAGLEGGALVHAVKDWVRSKITYSPGASTAQTTALDTFVQRHGVCRDFAHLMVTLTRAAAIPARFVSAFGPGVKPQDFHAVAEVFLDGAWQLIDATDMTDASSLAVIGVGRDAADVAFLTSFEMIQMVQQSVEVQELD
ncbi:transglutaminase-like domain-containing protein [Litoreibacter roseus]|uniref:Transglutaminase n=1 Tax=Litoreibacter roseus TaxID=2601869 RepID=A0A6N6JF46_9RHOB|nr:transglutaminase family protein [Litoreibacter roseus]GFE63999.1 transglutaminase [Litoreibacter roseus]